MNLCSKSEIVVVTMEKNGMVHRHSVGFYFFGARPASIHRATPAFIEIKGIVKSRIPPEPTRHPLHAP